MFHWKTGLLASRLGARAVAFAHRAQLLRAALARSEALGSLANDHVALRLAAGLSRPDRVFVDVGSHLGSVLAMVRQAHRRVRVVALEPVAEKAERLRKAFPWVEVHAMAAGERAERRVFYVHRSQSALSTLIQPGPAEAGQYAAVAVDVCTLDQVVRAGDVDVVKLDVEGAELEVLRGARWMLEASAPVVVFQSKTHGVSGPTEELYRFFREREYDVLVPDRVAHFDPGLSEVGFLESHIHPRRTTNYVAVPRARRLEVRTRARALLGLPLDRRPCPWLAEAFGAARSAG